ncbi:WxL domain-containing protein [Candidatus Enterococcus mangumiae]|uniref:WxL domain-containing protein n=1 Tax=Candidatus Enterococcus mangumiae TaxID=2230878 RepID=A0ABZ2SWQ9_9ENTE|nr:WxL domain-containing protein [Enterococcus sp. DIV1094]MBO0489627.1 WxL domain-containing protein [Enterococcus sp. DIV1094]
MKFVRLATIAALTSTIFAGGITAFAEETTEETSKEVRNVTTDGTIGFTANGDDELVVVPPEEGPEVDIDPEVPGTTGPLSIMKAVTMNFGSQVISNQNQTYNMIAEKQQKKGTTGEENKVPYVSFAQVQDVRGTNAGWDLQVRMTDFKATTETVNDTLLGAEISLLDPRIQYEGSTPENAPSFNAPFTNTDEVNYLKLMPNASAVSVMTAEKDKGAGVSSVVWGNQADLDKQEADDKIEVVTNNAIQLFVPGSTAKDATQYKSTLTWELSNTPGSNGVGGEDDGQPEENDEA